MTFALTTTSPLSLTSADSLTLSNGASAIYSHSSGDVATFTYKVGSGDNFTGNLTVIGASGFAKAGVVTASGPAVATAQTTVMNEAGLKAAIAAINSGGPLASALTAYTINLGADITLTQAIDVINLRAGVSLTINGGSNAYSINGANGSGVAAYQGFFVEAGAVTIKNTALDNTLAQGGTGSSGDIGGAGGGAGLGGGLFVAANADVTLSNVDFSQDVAIGGTGGSGEVTNVESGAAGLLDGSVQLGANFGDGGVTNIVSSSAFAGGFGGGGGGEGAALQSIGGPGPGGFGAGAGSIALTAVSLPEVAAAGGGGLGAGVDVFVQSGGVLSVSSSTLGQGTVTPGSGGMGWLSTLGATVSFTDGSAGSAYGDGIFLQGDETITLGAGQASGQTTEIDGVIADQSGNGGTGSNAGAGALEIAGSGIVDLAANNSFTGGIMLDSGTLVLGAVGAAGTGAISFTSIAPATLIIDGGVDPVNEIDGFAADDLIDLVGLPSVYAPTTLCGADPSSFTLATAGNSVTQTNSDSSELVSTFKIAGEAFTSDAADYTASSQFVSEVFYAANGSVYFDYAGTATTVATFDTYQAALDLALQAPVISDSAADVSGYFDALDRDVHIGAITLTDAAPVLTLTVEQALNDTAALHAITNSSYHIDIVDTASDLEALLNTQITALASEGVTELTASDATVNYNGQQTAAILAAGLAVTAPANDKVVESQAAPLDNYSYFFGPTGALTKFATYHADKTSEIIFYTPGTFEGIPYVNSDETLDANGNRVTVKYYSVNPSDPGGPLIVRISQTVEANGVISVDFYNDVGVLLKQQNNLNGVILDTRRYTAGSAFGVSYASCDVVFNASGKVTARTYYDAGGDALVTQTFTSNGYTLTAPDGTLTYSKAVDSDGNYETGYYGDTKAGQAFESNQFDYNSAGVKIANSFDTQTGNGQLNLIGDGLVASTLEGTVGPTAAPGDFIFTPHTTGETYNFFSSATNDVVDFTSGFGTAIVKGFAGTNAASYVLNLSSLFGSLGAAQTATQVLTNGNTTITAGTDVITLVGVTQALTAKQMGFA